MSEYTDGGSMKGSGIDTQWVSFDAFTCGDLECGYDNEADDTTTDDWGNYEVVCIQCGWQYFEGSTREN